MRKIKTSTTGYKKDSPDKKEKALIIPSGKITMKNVQHPVFGVDEFGNSMMMFPGGEYEFPGNQVTEIPMMQTGGQRPPIYTNNPNDPRLGAYQDSLALYNDPTYGYSGGIDAYGRLGRLNGVFPQPISGNKQNTTQRYKKPVQPVVYQKPQQTPIKKGQPTYEDSLILSKTKTYLPVKGSDAGYQKEIDDIIKSGRVYGSNLFDDPKVRVAAKRLSPTGNEYDIKPIWTRVGDRYEQTFKKPVGTPQPQEPKFKAPTRISTDRPNMENMGFNPNIPAPNMQRTEWNNTKPTKWSFTYPTGSYNEHKTVYFPDKTSWKNFIQTQRGMSSQEGEDYGTATGYLQAGGTIPNAGSPYDLLSEYETAEYSLRNAKKLKLDKNGNFKGLIPLEDWSDDLMNYVDKIKFVTRNKERFAKVRGKLIEPEKYHTMPDGTIMANEDMKKGGLTPNKARKILHDKKVHGKPLTEKQRKFFGAMSKGNTMNYEEGGEIEMKKGGIYIKPENRGKFTAWAKRHGMGVQEAAGHVMANKEDYSPSVVKMANFAKNFGGRRKAQLGEEIPGNETAMFDEFGYPTFPPKQYGVQPAGFMKSSYPASGINPAMFSNISPAEAASSGKLAVKNPNKPKEGISIDNLGALNLFNLGLTKLGESLRNKEMEEYTRQMQVLMNQPATTFLTREQQYGNPMNAQIGGVIPENLTYLSLPISIPSIESAARTVAPSATSQRAISGTASSAYSQPISLSPEFSGYAEKADKYIKSKGVKTDVNGNMLASAAQQAFMRYGKLVPVELALAQMELEGYLAKDKKPNKPQRTKNPFNVGNTDTGATVTHGNVQGGINAYYNLIAKSYLKTKTPEQLLENFTNAAGNRYASAPNYESGLKNLISKMKFRKGGTYEVSDEEIEQLRNQGYEFEEI